MEDKSKEQIPENLEEPMEVDQVDEGELLDLRTVDKEHEITNQFLAGKLSFTEFTEQLEDDETESVEPSKTGVAIQGPSTSVSSNAPPETKTRRVRKPRGVLPPTLKGLVGEANLRYARGDHKNAEKMCLEVIRQVPTAAEPFLTLAQIYEVENPEKSLQFSLIAAHLTPNNEDQWVRLGVISEDLGNYKQADTCYAKAILSNPSNIELHLRRIELLESLGEKKLVMKAKMRALNYMTGIHYEIVIPFAKELTKYFHQEDDILRAMEALDIIFRKCPEHVTSELCNIMLELLLQLKNYKYCLEILVQHCNIDIELETDMFNEQTGEIENIQVISYNFPATLPIDLQIKFIVCMIHLKAFGFLDALLMPLVSEEENVEKNGDLYLDVAEALMFEKRFEDALKLLVPLVKSKNFGMAAVWLRYAECLRECNLLDKSIESYKQVMELAPQHIEMRHPLTDLLIKLDRKVEALAVLKQDETCEEIDPGLLFKRCKLLRELKQYKEYWKASLLLLTRNGFMIRNRHEVATLTNVQKYDRKSSAIKLLRTARGEDPWDVLTPFSNKNEPTTAEEFELYKDIVQTCLNCGRYDLMQRFTFTLMGTKRFKDYKREMEVIAVYSCIRNEDYYNGYNLIRDLVQHNLSNAMCWNVYNIMVQRSDDSRHNRFLMRLLVKINFDLDIHVLQANNCLVAGTYKYALSEYIELYRMREEPMYAFLIGVTLFQMASQKFSAKKDYLVIQGLAFFNVYKKLRGRNGQHEVNYNLGRGYHQIGMLHLAAEHYKRVLNVRNSFVDKYPNILNLKREAAFNLHLIYKSSGAHDLARMCLYRYNVV